MRKNTKILVETWRRFLNESTIDKIYNIIDNIEDNAKITLEDMGNKVLISYKVNNLVKAHVFCQKINKEIYANSREVWETKNTRAVEGLGPLLYDVCLEYISIEKSGAIMSDRNTISDKAESVWAKYMTRSANEENMNSIQMDFAELELKDGYSISNEGDYYSINYSNNGEDHYEAINQVTPKDRSDDVNQYSTFNKLISKGYSIEELEFQFLKSPLSKAYYKESLDVITKLKSLNLYIEE
jgi:hypothetical protein